MKKASENVETSPRKTAEDLEKATKDWRGLRVTCKLVTQNRSCEIQNKAHREWRAMPETELSIEYQEALAKYRAALAKHELNHQEPSQKPTQQKRKSKPNSHVKHPKNQQKQNILLDKS